MQASRAIIIKNILMEAVKRGASDLHFSVGNLPVLRINNNLISLENKEMVEEEFMDDLVEMVLDKDQQATLTQNKEIVLTYSFDSSLRFKISIFYQKGLLSATLRYIPTQVPTLNELGLSRLSPLLSYNKGLIIISGPFGSGRTSTIAALLEEINQTRKQYVITIEQPIEYIFTNKKSIIEQREVGRDTKSFIDALNYFQEENGDVLYLEDMNDPKVIPLALEIARGSSLVLSSISAKSATETVSRILDSFQSFDQDRIRDLLATSLRAVICQKLLSKVGGGLIPVLEVMIVNDAVRAVISSGSLEQLTNIIQTSRQLGMVSFDQSLAELLKLRKISQEEAMDNSTNKQNLAKFI